MEFRQLKYFLAVVESGSISKAAARLFIAQSALSQQIAQLEECLGVALLYRSSRGVSMTESGLAFYDHAQAIMRQIGYAHAAVSQQSSESPVGAVTIGLSPTISAAVGLPLCLAARRELPGVILQSVEEATDGLIDRLKQGQLNLAVLADDRRLEQFAGKRVMEEHLYLLSAANAKHSSKARKIRLKDALHLPLVLPGVQHGVRQRLEKTAEEHGLGIDGLVAEFHSLSVLKRAVLDGIGATIMPLAPFQVELNHGLVQAQAIHDPGIVRTLAVFTSRDAPLTKATCAVSKLVAQVASELYNAGEWRGAMPISRDREDLTA